MEERGDKDILLPVPDATLCWRSGLRRLETPCMKDSSVAKGWHCTLERLLHVFWWPFGREKLSSVLTGTVRWRE